MDPMSINKCYSWLSMWLPVSTVTASGQCLFRLVKTERLHTVHALKLKEQITCHFRRSMSMSCYFSLTPVLLHSPSSVLFPESWPVFASWSAKNKQSQAGPGQWLQLSNKPSAGSDGMGLCAGSGSSSERLSQSARFFSGMQRQEPWDQRCELGTSHVAQFQSLYHIRHGNIVCVFFSLQDQSFPEPSKQRWNNSLFALCGLCGGWRGAWGGGGGWGWIVLLCSGLAGSALVCCCRGLRWRWKQSFLSV